MVGGRSAFALGLMLAVLAVGCDVLAGRPPDVTLAVRSEPGEGVGYDPVSISAPAGALVALSFINVSSLDHNLVFLGELTARTEAIVGPGATERIQFLAPDPGTYDFACTIHEEMRGTLVTEAATAE